MKQIKVSDNVHSMLKEISDNRKIDESFVWSQRAITEKLIIELYNREKKAFSL